MIGKATGPWRHTTTTSVNGGFEGLYEEFFFFVLFFFLFFFFPRDQIVLLYLTKLTQEIKFEDIGKSSLTFIVLLK